MKLIFMGTPDFAAETLEALVKAGHEILAAVTQPDKPRGRGKKLQMSQVKEMALGMGIEVLQPLKMKDEAFKARMEELAPEAIIVAAFGKIIPDWLLNLPKYGCLNVHASLLPAYRGAAPIQRAVIDGRKESGVTIMQMDAGLDTGDMLSKIVVPLEEKETGGSLFAKLSKAGAGLLVETLVKLQEGKLAGEKQPEESTTAYAAVITKEDGHIVWEKDAVEIERLVRGMNPWPSAFTSFHGKNLKIWEASVIEETEKEEAFGPGQVIRAEGKDLIIATGKGSLKIKSLQLEGKKRMETDAFLRGNKVDVGTILS